METSLNGERCSDMCQDLDFKLKLSEEESREDNYDSGEEFHEEDEEYDEEEEEFSFSTAFDGVNKEQISAEEAFDNGQIKTVFPLFNRDLLLEDGEDLVSLKLKDLVPNVKNVFVETNTDANHSSSATGDDEAVGPYCEWSKKAVEVAPPGCKKSNSTGFSKIWRFKDVTLRSNSDGRDAFVFLDNTASSSSTNVYTTGESEQKVAGDVEKKKVRVGGGKVNGNGGEGEEVKAKKVVKSKKAAPSPHEVYLRSKAKDGRRSYLPYRPGVVGFFTNVSGGGLTRNVHPF